MSDAPLTSTAPVTRFRSSLEWLLLSAALVVAAGVAVIIDRLQERGDECRRVQTELAALDAAAHELDALEWKTLFKQKLSEEVSKQLEKIQTEIQERFSRLGLLGWSLPQLARFTNSYRAYVRLVDQEFKLIAAAKIKEAEELDETKVDPAFNALETAMEESEDAYNKLAIRTLGQVRVITPLVLLGSVGFIAVLIWQFNKKRQLVAVAAAGQRVLRLANELLESKVRERTAEISALNQQLESRVAERTRELQQTNRQLQTEVGEHTRAEEALHESEDRFHDLFENATDLIQIVSPDGHFVFVNRAWKQALGYTDEELLNLTVLNIVAESSKAHCTDAFRRLMNGEDVPGVEAVFVGKQGQRITVEGSITCRRAGGKPGNTRGIFRDVTARKQAEKTLQRLRDQHALILNSVSEGVHGLDLDGRVTFENPASAAMLGYAITDLIGRPAHGIMHHTRPDGTPYPESECLVYATMRDGLVRQVNDEVFWRKDGTSFLVEYTSAPLRDQDGRIIGATVVFTDITARKRLEAQLFQSQKLETVGTLAGGIAHQFNSILTAIIGQSELLLGDLPAASPLAKNVAEIRKAAERATTLTRQLLAYGRKTLLRPALLDLNQVIAKMENTIRHIMGGNVDVRIVSAAGLHAVKADAGQIEQVILNLAMNAADAMPNGGKLTLETANVSFDRESVGRYPDLKAGDYVMLAVTDSGSGMSEEVTGHLFEPFFTTKGVGQGTGLGLSTCYGIIKQGGGHISVYTELGRGTTFKIYLPQAERQTKIPLQRLDSPDLPHGTETILLVEDDPALREMAATLLRRLGYTVLTAANGVEALSLHHQRDTGHVDLLFTDVVMPHMNGRELADRVRALYPRTRILFTSAYTEYAIQHQGGLNLNAALLQKPFTPSALALTVRAVLDEPGVPEPGSAPKPFEFTTLSDEAKPTGS